MHFIKAASLHAHWGILLVLLPALISSQEAPIPLAEQSAILLKGLMRNRSLANSKGQTIHIGVLYKSIDGAAAEASQIGAAFAEAGKDGAAKFAISAEPIQFESMIQLIKLLDTARFNGIYIHTSMLSGLSTVLQVTRGKKIASLGGSRAFVERGVSLGVYRKNNKPRLILNLQTCRIEGLDFDPSIALISTVLK